MRFFHTDGGFFRSLDIREVRIDYITHHVTGFLGYARLMRARDDAGRSAGRRERSEAAEAISLSERNRRPPARRRSPSGIALAHGVHGS